jgi:3-isopropylmalate/(R)-2-methylmalate dehydratase small subunit
MNKKNTVITGKVYVLTDNVDTDQIIPAKHLTLVQTKPDEYRKLGSLALSGLPESLPKFVKPGKDKSEFSIIIAGRNFGCGSSREHAPVALGAAGVKAVVAESYARIFFRNVVATGDFYPLEARKRICQKFKNGDSVEIDVDAGRVVNTTTGASFELKPIGAVADVIDAGGIFGYARETGMIRQKATTKARKPAKKKCCCCCE